MPNRRTTEGIIFAGLWLLVIFMIGAWVPSLPPEMIKLEEQPINLPKVSNPILQRDRDESVKIMNVARQIPSDFNYLLQQYDQIAAFNVHRDPHLTADQVERYITGYDAYRDEMNNFQNNTVGERPSIFRVLAYAGMIQNYHQVVQMRAMVRVNMNTDEFYWVRDRLMEAGLFAVTSSLEEGRYDSPEQKQHLESLREQMYPLVGAAKVMSDGSTVYQLEKWKPEAVPVGNINLFLDYYRRPNQSPINWVKIHFHRPTEITFDREMILRRAANNPP